MLWHGPVGIVALILGILHFISPKTVCKIDDFGKHMVVSMEHMVMRHPKKLGVFYLLAAVLLIYVGFFLDSK